MKINLHRKATQYIFFEMWPSFIMGMLVFIFILLMFQALHYTEFVLIHGVSLLIVLKMLTYISIGFLPALFPMALLFSVLMTYGRLSQDSEVIALKATGHSMWAILAPAIILSLGVAVLSAQTSFHLSPWGNRQFEILISQLEQTKASATIKEGTFSEGFFDMVVYANEVNTKKGELKNIFIYDERTGETPLTVIAHSGKLIQNPESPGNSALLRLNDGDIHRKSESHTKIKFDSFDLRLFDQVRNELREKSPQSLTIDEIKSLLEKKKLKIDDRRELEVEYHKRWAVSLVCIVFALLGVGLGTTTNSRHQKNNGLILSIIVVISYWILYVSMEGLARTGKLPAGVAVWLADVLFAAFAVRRLNKNWD